MDSSWRQPSFGAQSPKVSVVTICYNEADNISKTLESVARQTYVNIEHVIKDGGSADGTVDIVRQYAKKHPNAVVEISKDGGLYNAMNIGLSKCTGDYVIFLNAGDRFVTDDVIGNLVLRAEVEELPDLVYGDCASEVNGELMVRSAHGPSFMKIGMPASHEAMLYKRSLIKEHNLIYDTSYRIAADYKFTYQFVNAAKKFAYLPSPVVIFSEGGVSTSNKLQGMMEANRARKEVGGLPFLSRMTIILMQSGALFLSTFVGPLYRYFRLQKIRIAQ